MGEWMRVQRAAPEHEACGLMSTRLEYKCWHYVMLVECPANENVNNHYTDFKTYLPLDRTCFQRIG